MAHFLSCVSGSFPDEEDESSETTVSKTNTSFRVLSIVEQLQSISNFECVCRVQTLLHDTDVRDQAVADEFQCTMWLL